MIESPVRRPFAISLQSAFLVLIAVALLAGILPAGIVLDRWLARELEARAWRDVALAPAILADRGKAIGDAMMMHAKEVAHSPALVAALARDDHDRAVLAAVEAAQSLQRRAVVVTRDGAVLEGPAPPAPLLAATRRGEMPVFVVADSTTLYLLSVAAVEHAGVWIGAAGVAAPLDAAAAEALAGLTRSDLVIVLSPGAPPVASVDAPVVDFIVREMAAQAPSAEPREVRVDGARHLLITAPMAGATVAFVRDLRRELAILPELRRILYVSGSAALAVALLLGLLLALVLIRPVRALAAAADRVKGGDFDTPLAPSVLREVGRVMQAFDAMRAALARRIDELRSANRALEERQARLATLQSELIRRERVAATGRMAAELAHEIRNPVANLRNCLELLHRRLADDAQGSEFAELAIDELLRMHELTERMLDLNRPTRPDFGQCDAAEVAREVAALTRIGVSDAAALDVTVDAVPCGAALPRDALKQVLLNLVQNARDAMPRDLAIIMRVTCTEESTRIDVIDNGPGIDPGIRSRIFDPFFTTRSGGGGIGLGLFVVEGVVRAHGGSVEVLDGEPGRGACFRISLPRAEPNAVEAPATTTTAEKVP